MELNKKQRKFLEYLRDEVKYAGNTRAVNEILQTGEYDADQIETILYWFRKIRTGMYRPSYYGNVTKYIKD